MEGEEPGEGERFPQAAEAGGEKPRWPYGRQHGAGGQCLPVTGHGAISVPGPEASFRRKGLCGERWNSVGLVQRRPAVSGRRR
jgi:hypothetical protein